MIDQAPDEKVKICSSTIWRGHEMKPLRTAILGCGRIAKRHADILATLDDVRLVGYCDQNVPAAQEFAKRLRPGEGL